MFLFDNQLITGDNGVVPPCWLGGVGGDYPSDWVAAEKEGGTKGGGEGAVGLTIKEMLCLKKQPLMERKGTAVLFYL